MLVPCSGGAHGQPDQQGGAGTRLNSHSLDDLHKQTHISECSWCHAHDGHMAGLTSGGRTLYVNSPSTFPARA